MSLARFEARTRGGERRAHPSRARRAPAAAQYANTGNIPQYYAWFNHINPLHYGFVALSHIQWEHYPDIACDAALPIECPFVNGKSVLAFYSLDGHGTGAARGILLLLVIGACYRVLAFAVMLRRASRADAGV